MSISTFYFIEILKKCLLTPAVFQSYSKLLESHKDRSSESGDINNLAADFKKLGQFGKADALLKPAL
jgi:hypothetical protein